MTGAVAEAFIVGLTAGITLSVFAVTARRVFAGSPRGGAGPLARRP